MSRGFISSKVLFFFLFFSFLFFHVCFLTFSHFDTIFSIVKLYGSALSKGRVLNVSMVFVYVLIFTFCQAICRWRYFLKGFMPI